MNDTYAVVTNNFCAAGGDTYYAFANASSQYDTGIVMDEAVMDYVKEVLGGNVSSAQYGKVRGDQTIITSATDAATIADAKAAVQNGTGAQAPEATPAEAPAETAPAAEAAPVETQPSADTYVVVSGDNLWKIAAAVYGDGNKWSVIYDLNNDVLKYANSIKVGQELKVK